MIGFGLGWQELMIMLFIVLLLFGSTKLPILMRSIGLSLNEFKRGMNDPGDDLAQKE